MHKKYFNCRNRIRQYRKKRHLRLVDIRRLISHKSCAHISHWEKGRKLPSLTNALKLAAAIKCPVEILFLEQYQAICKDIIANKEKKNINYQYEYENE